MNKKTIITIGMIVLTLVMAVGYAVFSTNLVINGTANIESNWSVEFTKIEQVSKTSGVTIKATPTATGTSATFNVDLTSPGDKIEYKITVTNKGTLNAIIKDIKASETGSDAIIFEITNIKVGDKLSAKASTTFNVTISYDNSITSQPNITDNKLTIAIDYVQDVGQTITSENIDVTPTRLYSKILAANTPQSDANIDFSKTSAQDGTKGLYYTSTNTEDNKTVYYFRGAVENNYVSFGTYKEGYSYTNVSGETITVAAGDPIIWRIVRINEDGSIRLIKQDGVSKSALNQYDTDYRFDNAYVGYMYGLTGLTDDDNQEKCVTYDSVNDVAVDSTSTYKTESACVSAGGKWTANAYEATHANVVSSTIKKALDTWYTKHLSSYSGMFSQNAGFCNDRSVADKPNTWSSDDTALGFGTNVTIYRPANRIYENKNPQFVCPQTNDLFTLSTSSKGNKALTNPIGLLTADEVVYAGETTRSNHNYYLSNNDNWWIMSPYGNSLSIIVFYFDIGLIDVNVYEYSGVRPVVSLQSNVEIISNGADGSIDKPYVIKTN